MSKEKVSWESQSQVRQHPRRTPPLHLLAGPSTSTCRHPVQPGPDTHVSISRAPAHACPASHISSFISLHLPPWAGLWQAALARLRICSRGDAGRSNAQFPRMSPNCACLRLRRRLEFLLLHCQDLVYCTAPSCPLPSALPAWRLGFRLAAVCRGRAHDISEIQLWAQGTGRKDPLTVSPDGGQWEAGGGWFSHLHPFSPLLRRRTTSLIGGPRFAGHTEE